MDSIKRKKPAREPFHMQLASGNFPLNSSGTSVSQTKKRTKYVERDSKRERSAAVSGLDGKLSERILQQARQQMEAEMNGSENEQREPSAYDLRAGHHQDDDECDSSELEEDYAFDEDPNSEMQLKDEYDQLAFDLNQVSNEDQRALDAFMSERRPERRTLADIIMEKFHQQGAIADESQHAQLDRFVPPDVDPKVVEVFGKVGTLLSRYRSGKLPKAFKIIPSLRNWEEILYLTRPEEWTPNAMYQATRIFVSNLKPKMAQRFLNIILLESVRQDIQSTRKLNYHLYMSLKKGLYKPAAWFKGILFPICEAGDCTLREAIILGSVLSKVSVPVLHSAAALLKLAEMEYSGACSIFIRVLLDKKYALPYRVVDGLVNHFLRFKADPRTMHVLWHQSLLVFAQRYKEDMAVEQKEALLDLIKHKTHHQISSEIRRELTNSKCRDGEVMMGDDGLPVKPTQPATSQQAIAKLLK